MYILTSLVLLTRYIPKEGLLLKLGYFAREGLLWCFKFFSIYYSDIDFSDRTFCDLVGHHLSSFIEVFSGVA